MTRLGTCDKNKILIPLALLHFKISSHTHKKEHEPPANPLQPHLDYAVAPAMYKKWNHYNEACGNRFDY